MHRSNVRPSASAEVLGAPRFVQREVPIRWCETMLASASSGRPRVGLVTGEAGVGKTRLLRELGTLATARGFAVHVGRAAEGSPVPLRPLRQALEDALTRGSRRRRRAVATDGIAFLRGEAPMAQHRADADVGPASVRLAWSIVGSTLELARKQPLLLILDDLQWADAATLETFELLAFTLADAATAGQTIPFFLVAGVRPPEPERLARAVARLQRETVCETLALGGLDEDETTELLEVLVGAPVTHLMADTARRVTAGNPLFLQELVRHLQRIDALRRHGRFVTIPPGSIDLAMPPDVRVALRERTSDLDAASRALLTMGAMLGDPFELATLRSVANAAAAELATALEQWTRSSLVTCDGTRAYFVHPLIRQGLLAEVAPPRRMQVNADIAQALGAMAEDDDRCIEIAHHLIAAGSTADPEQVVTRCMRAAELASARHAWIDAARFYEAALEAMERHETPPSDLARSRLHYHAGFAHYRDQDAGTCLTQFDAAIACARSAGDPVELVRALLGRIRARFTLVSAAYGERLETTELEGLIARIARREPVLAGVACTEMAQTLWTARQSGEARTFGERGLAIGRRHKTPMLIAEAHRALSLICAQEVDPRGALAHLEAGLDWAHRGKEVWIESQILQRMVLPLLWLGRIDRLDALISRATASTEVVHDWGDHSLAHGGLTCWAVARGDLEAAESSSKEALRLLRRSRYPWAGPTMLPAIALARALSGAWSEADEALAMLERPGEIFDSPGASVVGMSFVLRQLLLAWEHPAERDRVRASLEPFTSQIEQGVRADVYALGLAAAVADLAAMLDSRALAESVQPHLLLAHQRGVVLATGWVALISRALGVCAAVLGRWDEAVRWFEEATVTSRKLRLRTESLRTSVAFASMLGRRSGPGDVARALDLLAVAVPQLRDRGMTTLLAEASALAGRYTPSARPARHGSRGRAADTTSIASGGPRLAIMFTDLEGSTSAYDRLGDAAGRALVRAHDAVVRDVLRRGEGTLMKHTGDGAEVAFSSVEAACKAAVRMQKGFARHSRRNPERAIRVRIGINVGEPLAENGDLFGSAVNVAARVCARAKGGEILLTDHARRLVDSAGLCFRTRGTATLRGVRTPVELYQIVW